MPHQRRISGEGLVGQSVGLPTTMMRFYLQGNELNNSENLLSSTSGLAFVFFSDCFNSWMTHCGTGETDGSQVMNGNDLGDDLTFFSSFLVDQAFVYPVQFQHLFN